MSGWLNYNKELIRQASGAWPEDEVEWLVSLIKGCFGYLVVAMALAAVVPSGCSPAIYTGTEPAGGAAASLSSRSSWRAYGDLAEPYKSIDGSIATAAVSGTSYDGAKLTLDLGRKCMFNAVILDQGPRDEYGYCRRIAVLISNDGYNFKQIYAAAGTRRITYIPLLTPTVARYIRLVATVPGDRPWSVAEVFLQ